MKQTKIKQNFVNFQVCSKACISRKPTLPYIKFVFNGVVTIVEAKTGCKKKV